MSDGKKEGGVFGQIAVAVVVALLAGGTAPWWWEKIIGNSTVPSSPAPSHVKSTRVPVKTPTANTVDESPPSLLLATGQYGGAGSIFRGTYRVIAKVGGKMCIALINGTPTPYRGNSEIIVSSLSWRDGKFHVDATNEQLVILSQTSFTDEIGSRLSWTLETEKIQDFYRTRLNTCLKSNGKYKHSELGDFIDGIPYP
ncbi:hypothetical protein C7B65_04530 [Phormidesmis priestleyi ULC007]|uniref:Uncharacterized protein n=1 Tax=Phormidesmis priestleyi ULC007 TaxID=1920490 RepID=A0A2T1DL76_9CYAN|nr:hypothetical protein [Phormidesmis priestleyi]PSB21205.1 hypothetical protein C7B65_04530 [Phormidesmis priestleyi ULC007]PZO51267.1 MAG: hypothetical protein DCF14_09175 [Phormidesmis priestleyi]